ncbi:MAG: cysteine synthase [Desulfobacteraceae bacterium]|nr:cysteine synthase [Desulfobacteraceae bacterium]
MTASIINLIGNTPIVEIKSINPVPGVKIFAKLEYMNSGGSIKDRAALYMITAAEAAGHLSSDKIVIEATSGNTGIGLAMICAVKGYKIALTMAQNASEERKQILQARGAQIILTPKHLGSDGAIEEAYRLARENPDQYFLADQYNNEANWKAHYHTTGPEIMDQTNGKVTSIVASIGTSGTLMGLSRYFKQVDPKINIVCAEPYLGHKIQGLKNMKESYVPEIFDKKRLDATIRVDDDRAFETARQLARVEGLFVGMSSGAAMAAAIEHAQNIQEGVVVVIFPDGGERYLSTQLFSVEKKIDLKVYNSFTKQKELFVPIEKDKIGIYTCGPTVDQRLHIGLFRRFVFTDLLIRFLEFHQFIVNHIINITDYDDKTIEGAGKTGQSVDAFVLPNIAAFKADLATLGLRPAQTYPRVSDHFTEMTDLSRTLLDRHHAYEKLHSVYFDIASQPEYGDFSKVDLNKIRLGATVDLDGYEKRNPKDFTLLKRVRLSELKRGVGIKTEWGNVRPSLHLQCSAIAMRYLGKQFDIHTGSRDLLFPHHENEIAIARAATGSSLANVWMHCDPVQYDGSLGKGDIEEINLDTLIHQGWDAKTIRFWLIFGHYRKQLVLSIKGLRDAKYTLVKINRCIETLGAITMGGTFEAGDTLEEDDTLEVGQALDDIDKFENNDQLIYDIRQGVLSAMADDLKVSDVISCLLLGVKKINRLINLNQINAVGAKGLLSCFREVDSILKIFDFNSKMEYSKAAQSLMKERDEARLKNDWILADKIRNKLVAMGVCVHDKKV